MTLAHTVDEISTAVSDKEIQASQTPHGGWDRETLAKWGVGWPPPKGWRQRLIENFDQQGNQPETKGSSGNVDVIEDVENPDTETNSEN